MKSPRSAPERPVGPAIPAVKSAPGFSLAPDHGLPEGLRGGLEHLSGFDLSGVRVHRNSSKPAQAGAHALTQGNDIHLGPGQEKHLPHEGWHLVQQRRGRVQPTTEAAGVRVNDDAALEREADRFGAQAAAFRGGSRRGLVAKQAYPDAPAQLKSKFNPGLAPTKKDTPLETLHKTFGSYFTTAKVGETYNFHGLSKPVAPTAYAATWGWATKVSADIDHNAKAGPRDNKVIGPYGHFGAMERSIFNRQKLGNTYDGGHLVAHELMDGSDADVEGNLAPQEDKNFNQGLMRGWERVAEELVKRGEDFTYEVEVDYIVDSYDRTGTQIVNAGILNPALVPKLLPADLVKLHAETLTFVRWVPFKWSASIDAGAGKIIKPIDISRGAHYDSLVGSVATAEGNVVDGVNLAPNTAPKLKRQRSGTLSGHIDTASAPLVGGVPDPKRLRLGGKRSLQASLYQPQPQDTGDQPKATTTVGGGVPAVLPSSTIVVNRLTAPLSLTALVTELQGIDPFQKPKKTKTGKVTTAKKRKSDANIDSEAKKGPLFKKIRPFITNPAESAKLVVPLSKSKLPFSLVDWTKYVQGAGLSVGTTSTLLSLDADPNFLP